MVRQVLHSIALLQAVELDAPVVIDVSSRILRKCEHLVVVQETTVPDIFSQIELCGC